MAVIMDEKLKKKLERIGKRRWWPVALLADILEISKVSVYNKINEGKFDIINDVRFMKITSDSVIKYYSEDHHQII